MRPMWLWICWAGLASGASAQQPTTVRASVSDSGVQANQWCVGQPTCSSDGTLVAFQSYASNLVPGDTNDRGDVFVRDLIAGTTVRVSVSSTGIQGNRSSAFPAISADGGTVAFYSEATNLVLGGAGNIGHIYVHEIASGVTTLASVSSGGGHANGYSLYVSISGDGRLVAFQSGATNLVPDDTNLAQDVFVHDRLTGQTVRASVSTSGVQTDRNAGLVAGGLAEGGSCVAFVTDGTTLVPGASNGWRQVFVRDLAAGVTTCVSLAPGGAPASGHCDAATLSGDGRFVAFESAADNLVPGDTNGTVDVFVHDRSTGLTRRVSVDAAGSQASWNTLFGGLSPDGRYLTLVTVEALVPGDTNGLRDVYVKDLESGGVVLASVSESGALANGHSLHSRVSREGRRVAFGSDASNLVPGDTNGVHDVFVRDLGAGVVHRYCLPQANSLGCVPAMDWSGFPAASGSAPFMLTAAPVLSGQNGLLIYGFAPAATPFLGGVLCLAPPVVRTSRQYTGEGSACGGTLSYNMGDFIRSGTDPALTPGTAVFSQYWSRDPGAPSGSHLTDAVAFLIEP